MKPHKHRDVIVAWADGIDVQRRGFLTNGEWRDLEDGEQPNFFGSEVWRVKPAAPTYPVTLLSATQILDVVRATPGDHRESYIAIANAALRHAIDAGQIVTKDDHESALIQLGEHLRGIAITPDAARDMAIAEAVRDACYVAAMNCSAGLEGAVVRQIKLATIIATIK